MPGLPPLVRSSPAPRRPPARLLGAGLPEAATARQRRGVEAAPSGVPRGAGHAPEGAAGRQGAGGRPAEDASPSLRTALAGGAKVLRGSRRGFPCAIRPTSGGGGGKVRACATAGNHGGNRPTCRGGLGKGHRSSGRVGTMPPPRFEPADVSDELPVPGFYPSTITAARIRRSQSGNRMVHVVHALDGVPPGRDRVAEYFVLEGASPRGLALAKRRLVGLYRAARLDPREGGAIAPEELRDARLEVQVDHDEWQGERRLRVVGHRPPGAGHPGARPSCPAPPRCPRARPDDTAALPLRVAPRPDGGYEVIDGLKRLARWKEAGQCRIPVVVESPGDAPAPKRRPPRSHGPPRSAPPPSATAAGPAARSSAAGPPGPRPRRIARRSSPRPWTPCARRRRRPRSRRAPSRWSGSSPAPPRTPPPPRASPF